MTQLTNRITGCCILAWYGHRQAQLIQVHTQYIVVQQKTRPDNFTRLNQSLQGSFFLEESAAILKPPCAQAQYLDRQVYSVACCNLHSTHKCPWPCSKTCVTSFPFGTHYLNTALASVCRRRRRRRGKNRNKIFVQESFYFVILQAIFGIRRNM